jgi:hypothetical protein
MICRGGACLSFNTSDKMMPPSTAGWPISVPASDYDRPAFNAYCLRPL